MEKESFHFSYMILLLTIVASHSLASTQPRCREDERSALLDFKATFFTLEPPCCSSATSDVQANIESWNASTGEAKSDCCSWAGVECDEVSGHVIGLDLSCSCLSGKINSNTSIFRLLHLRSLNLAFNDFNCQIPPAIGNLGSLGDLNFSGSNFMGHIPHSLGNLTLLVHLDLSNNRLIGPTLVDLNIFNPPISRWRQPPLGDLYVNQFIGEIPSSFGRLGHTKHSDLRFNSFTGEIPSFLGNLVQLKDLSLAGNMFFGQIPSSLGNLVQLTCLDLSLNKLTGEIPSSIGNLARLTHLDLGYNQLVGEIPLSFQNLLELRFLTLRSNQLSGEIPFSLGILTQLIDVDLSFNQFHGAIPSTIFQLQNLDTLNLNSNNLSGTVKLDRFAEIEFLRVLGLSSNKLSLIVETDKHQQYFALGLGSCNLNGFPEFLQFQEELFFLDLSYNNISGQVPEWFLNVSPQCLHHLNLSGNFLTSFTQDPVIFKWGQLVVADLRFNELQGSVPIPPPEMWYYFISNNRLSGEISPLICNLTSIQMIDLSYNNLTGSLPQCLSNLSGTLEVMSLQSNNFIGKIPNLNGNSCALIMIDLSFNKLHGPLPRSLRNCDDLEFLNFGNNQISDVFPSWLGSLLNLKVLILRDNRFHELIGEPADRVEFPTLQIIDLSQNTFSGSLPSGYFKHWAAMKVSETNSSSYIGDAIKRAWIFSSDATFDYSMRVIAKGIQMNYSKIQGYLTLIDLSSNNFSGAIPETIGSLKQIELLNLSNNILFGPLPPFLANLTNLEALDLSQNQLSGEIPQELTQLTSLAVFNVSYNRMTGPIPQSRQFATFENNSYKGNSGLCGTPLSRKCGDPKASPPSSPTSEEDQDSGSAMEFDWKIVCMGYASGLVIGLVLENTLITGRRAQSLVKNFGRRKQRRRR
ncbi:receptor-like protein 49 [Syzygium oleosum]|uniref:receptor-like protein 49 n=1 Tax=Syzygium oleosum TaxID=219896 RepID=UPI0024B8D451|nr:receptor-like protein 49 [Syzygium oleosum]